MKLRSSILVWLSAALLLVGCEKDQNRVASSAPASRPSTPEGQTVCPVSNYDIDPAVFVEHEGKRVYLCCESCKERFQQYPTQFVPKLPQFGGKEEKSLGGMPK